MIFIVVRFSSKYVRDKGAYLRMVSLKWMFPNENEVANANSSSTMLYSENNRAQMRTIKHLLVKKCQFLYIFLQSCANAHDFMISYWKQLCAFAHEFPCPFKFCQYLKASVIRAHLCTSFLAQQRK